MAVLSHAGDVTVDDTEREGPHFYAGLPGPSDRARPCGTAAGRDAATAVESQGQCRHGAETSTARAREPIMLLPPCSQVRFVSGRPPGVAGDAEALQAM